MANGLLEVYGGQAAVAQTSPDGRLGQPEDIAGAVVFLASRASSHVNGSCLVVDGGSRWAKLSKL